MNPVERSRAINGDSRRNWKKDGQIERVRHGLAAHFKNHPDFQSEEEAFINGKGRNLLVYKHKSELTQKDIIAYPGEDFGIGDVVECYGAHWLITQKDPNTDIVCKGLMELCTLKMRWQNPKTLQIIERWAILKNPYSTNVDKGNVIATVYGKYKIFVPNDEETMTVAPDKRFIIGQAGGRPMVYKLTFPDPSSRSYDAAGPGILIWNVESDEDVHDTDNVELMIADYIAPSTSDQPEGAVPEFFCEISGKAEVIVGYSRKYACSFYNSAGAVAELTPRWYIENQEDVSAFAELFVDGTECTIKVRNDDNAINKTIILCCQSVDGNSEIAKYKIDCVVM